MSTFKLLIAEDEPLMRERLLSQLKLCWPDATIDAIAENGNDAWDAWLEHESNVVFLDIQMPGLDGLQVAEKIGHRAQIVFVTAYDQYAINAFERGAVDYLLKPIDAERLSQTVERIKQRASNNDASLQTVLNEIRQARPVQTVQKTKWLKANVGSQIRLINVDDVLFFQSDTKYTRVVMASGEALLRTTIKELIDGLDPDVFWQIHRATIVNVNAINSVQRIDNERMQVNIKDNAEKLPVSRTFAHLFRE